jgi:carbohydrate ABC transporter membrane protein 1, CUT1 family (TC 3.A.1.1.-)
VQRPARRASRRQRIEAINAYIFMAPAILGLLLFTLGPMAASFLLSFTEYNILTDPRWNGLANYEKLFNDKLFWQSLK